MAPAESPPGAKRTHERPIMADEKKSVDWQDIIARTAIPGLLIAFAGFVAEYTITEVSNKQENARLITNLQIQRENAESELRKDIFEHSLSALLSKEASESDIAEFSKRLLKLELLALNFGDSLSLSPLFAEFYRDLILLEDSGGGDGKEVGTLRKRLRGLAKRVASSQLSSLDQHGVVDRITIPLTPDGKDFAHGQWEYKWPNDEIGKREADDPIANYNEALKSAGTVTLDGVQRYVIVTLSDLRPEEMTVAVDIEVCHPGEDEELQPCDRLHPATIRRDFKLDFFNFPKIDNMRLSDNQRLSLILEDYVVTARRPITQEHTDVAGIDKAAEPTEDTAASKMPMLELAVAIFPSEYASLRDRPSMQEALGLLKRAQDNTDLGEDEAP